MIRKQAIPTQVIRKPALRPQEALTMSEMMERRDRFVREGIPMDFIQRQIDLARRQRNQEMGEAAVALLAELRRWVYRLGSRLGVLRSAAYAGRKTATAGRCTAPRSAA